jgi:putative membrane protein
VSLSLEMAVTKTGIVGWSPHPEVWVLLAGAIALGLYAVRVIQPAAIAAGYEPITRGQKTWFMVAVVGLWVTSDWPVHDVAEEQLYAVHMVQHLLLSLMLPAMFLLATPRWLVQLVVPEGSRLWNVFRRASRPLLAGVVFNALTAVLHITGVVHLSLAHAPVHFGLHLIVFCSGLLMWMPVCGPVQEWRLTPPGQMVYLFAMSLLPTVPGGWLIFADQVVYHDYDTPQRLWGISALQDQQVAGMLMKLVGGMFRLRRDGWQRPLAWVIRHRWRHPPRRSAT